ncbi:MAG: glycoside hydrolase family 26 protein, partial [Treponema sp.]|nr:glycoside hydrolase family 26 protein [Treponema sp.]
MKFLKRFLLFISAIFALIVVFSCTNKKSEGNASVEDVIIYEGYSWNFLDPSAGTAGWEAVPNEFWAYSGTAVLSRDDSTFGRGMLRFDVDFTADSHRDWSEPKLRYTFSEPFSLEGIVRFTFDFYYNPYYASGGHFRSKIIALDDNVTVLDSVSSGISGEEEVGDFVKATVSLRIRNTGRSMDGMLLSIAGYMTDYKGPVFFDNLRWEPENYVPVVEPFNFVMPKLPAPEPMPNKIRLMNYLTDVYGKSIISGQMDTSWTTNDVMDMIDRVFTDTGKYPAIKGFDLIQLSENYPPFFGGREQIDEAIEWWEGKNNGVRLLPNRPNIHGIVTFCWHWRMGVEKEFYTDRT